MKKIVITGAGMQDAYGLEPARCFVTICTNGTAGGQLGMHLSAQFNAAFQPRRVRDIFDVPEGASVGDALVRPAWRSQICAESIEWDYGVPRKEVARLPVKTQHGIATALYAVKAAGLDLRDRKLKNIIQVGADASRSPHFGELIDLTLKGERVNPHALLSYRPDYLVDFLSATFGLTAPACAITASCASGIFALDYAVRQLQAGVAEVALVSSMSAELSLMEAQFFNAVGAISRSPAGGSAPFDVSRSGLTLAEGSAAMVIETERHAKKRGAKIYAYLEGIGTSSDGEHLTSPSKTQAGAQRALDACLKRYQGDTVDYVLAHGTATVAGDLAEAAFLSRNFPGVDVSSVKGFIGHHVHNSALVELGYAVLSLSTGVLLPNAGLKEPIESGVNFLTEFKQKQVNTILKTSFGFGGKNGIVLLRKPSEGS
jgi:3-oxoacyl-[acyl-carrier-protein] synthase II